MPSFYTIDFRILTCYDKHMYSYIRVYNKSHLKSKYSNEYNF
jgi:hypothetical protein